MRNYEEELNKYLSDCKPTREPVEPLRDWEIFKDDEGKGG